MRRTTAPSAIRLEVPARVSGHLTDSAAAWTIQAVMASRWLTGLYRSLRDDHQAAMAIQAGTPTEERLRRLGLQNQVAPLKTHFCAQYPEETQAEEAAWLTLVEAHAGLTSFLAIAGSSDGKPAPGLQGARSATGAALRKALQGFDTAFPEAMVRPGVTSAVQRATQTCVDAFVADIEEKGSKPSAQLRPKLEACVREALKKAVVVGSSRR